MTVPNGTAAVFGRCNGAVVSGWARNKAVTTLVFFLDPDPGIGLRIHARVNTFFLAAGTLLGYDTRVETLLGSLVQVV